MFDPYYTWLGIPPGEQPPNHYRLLGVNLLEVSTDVIANAADKQMTFLKGFCSAEHVQHAQQLLNEVSAARICLLSRERKSQYDQQLRASVAFELPPPEPMTREQVRREHEQTNRPDEEFIVPALAPRRVPPARRPAGVEAPPPAPVYQVVQVTAPHNQALPALASLFITGLGQLIQGRPLAAFGWFCAAVVAFATISVGIGLFLVPLVWIICIVDAAQYQPCAASDDWPCCPTCGGRLDGQYSKCRYCRTDLVWECGVPKTRQQAKQEALLRNQHNADAERQREVAAVVSRLRLKERRQKHRERMAWFVAAARRLPGRVDTVLKEAAGEGNDILHCFLRVFVVSAVLVIIVMMVAVMSCTFHAT